jgi:hypothetical protein
MEPPERLVEAVKEAARRSSAARFGLQLRPGRGCERSEVFSALFPGTAELPPNMAADLLHRLFPESREMTVECLSAHPASVPVSRGHSVVCKVTPEHLAPFVVKFGPADKVEREASRYSRYVHDRLTGRYYSEMHASKTFWDAGATSYKFIGANEGRLLTFSERYEQEGDSSALLRPLRHFFADLWGLNYRAPSTPWLSPLFELYARSLKLHARLKEPQLRRRVAAAVAVSGADLPDPLLWLDQRRASSQLPDTRQAVTHGDLHGDNLFVDGDHAWVIDFERTGPGHILRDFAELEVDILTRLAPVPADAPAVALAFYQMAVLLTPDGISAEMGGWAGTGDGQKALAVLSGLRQLSREVTGRWRTEEYLWALLFDAVFLLSLAAPDSPQWRRALMLSVVLCRRLEEMRHTGEEQSS